MATPHISNGQPGHMRLVLAPPKPKSKFSKGLDRVSNFMMEYWGHMVAIVLGILVFAALSVPFLTYLGLNSIAKPIFFSLHYVCAQVPSHSFYIFGHQLGMCERNFSIYASMFIGSLIFVLSKKKMMGIPWWIWILMILPMAWDGTTQLFGWRESNWILRIITGTLFGFGNIWFALPLMQKSLEMPPPPQFVYQYSHPGNMPIQPVAPMVPAAASQAPLPMPVPAPAPVSSESETEDEPETTSTATDTQPASTQT